MVDLKLLHVRFGNNSIKHVILSKPIIYDLSKTQFDNKDLEAEHQKKYITTHIDESLGRHPYLDKIFQGFLKYVFAWFSIVDDYLE